jgi:hypothetical protein
MDGSDSIVLSVIVAGMVTLQNLQNLATLQSLPQVASLAAGLQGMAGLGTQLINTPLNLSANATGLFHYSFLWVMSCAMEISVIILKYNNTEEGFFLEYIKISDVLFTPCHGL